MSETTSAPAPPPQAAAPSASPPQTSNVFADRPCLKCGYNLRGQTATWNRRALNWQVTCPECGAAQVVALGSAERGGSRSPLFALALAVVAVYIAWQLITWLSLGQAAMMDTLTAIYATPTAAARRAAMTGAGVATAFDGEWTTLVIHVLVRGVPVLLSTLVFGIVLALAPYAMPRQRDLLLVLFVIGGCLFYAHLNLTGSSVDSAVSTMRTQLALGLSGGNSVLMLFDWKWRVISGTVGLALAILGGRIGLAVGHPLGRVVVSMYVKIDA